MAGKPLVLMVSSRSDRSSINDRAGGQMKLRRVRQALKRELEAETFLGGRLVEVWINEEEVGDHDQTAWDECVRQAQDCDLFVTLYDGSAGWSVAGGSVGICQAEFDAAFGVAPGKVKVIRLPGAKIKSGPDKNRDTRFLDALLAANRFEVPVDGGWSELRNRFMNSVREQVLKLAREGIRETRRSGGNVGQALDWSRMTFTDRSAAIGETIASALADRAGRRIAANGGRLVAATLDDTEMLFACHGAPRPLSTAAGREAVGQPFLLDHALVDDAEPGLAGPVHLIGCPKGVTDTQAVTLLGFPEFTVVEGSFGVYASDVVQKIQLCLLANCADPGSTRNAVERLVEWLTRSRELPIMAERAASRRRIIDAIRAEQRPITRAVGNGAKTGK